MCGIKQLRRDVWEFINRSKHKKCISSVPQSNKNSIEFSLSTQTRRVIKSPQAKSLHRRLMCQSDYMSMGMCFQRINQREYQYGNHMTMRLTLQKVQCFPNQPRCYQQTVNILSDYPRQMFKKNSMEFFLGLDYYLYYFTVAVLLLAHNHMFFQNVLWSLDFVT